MTTFLQYNPEETKNNMVARLALRYAPQQDKLIDYVMNLPNDFLLEINKFLLKWKDRSPEISFIINDLRLVSDDDTFYMKFYYLDTNHTLLSVIFEDIDREDDIQLVFNWKK